jgi:hypothetical protein
MLDFGSIGAARCPHGVLLVDADECNECLRLEAAKLAVLANLAGMLDAMTDPEDSATRALAMTAFGRYLSMKMHNADQAVAMFNTLAEIAHNQLPCDHEERMIAQAMLLTELSFSAHTPEPMKVFQLNQGGKR